MKRDKAREAWEKAEEARVEAVEVENVARENK